MKKIVRQRNAIGTLKLLRKSVYRKLRKRKEEKSLNVGAGDIEGTSLSRETPSCTIHRELLDALAEMRLEIRIWKDLTSNLNAKRNKADSS